MAKEIFMPKLSSTMQMGTLIQWFKEEGDTVEEGDPLFEIMTDKINIEVESYESGILLKKYFQIDDEIPVNMVIGYIGEKNELVPKAPPTESGVCGNEQEEPGAIADDSEHAELDIKAAENGKVRATPAARRVARNLKIDLAAVKGSGPNGRIHERDVKEMPLGQKTILVTPLAKKIANEKHIDLNQITGSGPKGKVIKADVLGYQPATADIDQPGRIKLTGLRKAVADKMLESTRSIPHVTLTTDVDMTHAITMRKALLPVIEQQTNYRLSYTEIIMKSTAHVLWNHPQVNASLVDNEIILNRSINIGLAVAVENGLIVPSVHDANHKGLAALTVTCKTLGEKARTNKLKPSEISGSTFTISNLGMYAIDGFTPIINPPETAILGVGRIVKKPVVVDETIEIRPMMVLSLSFDHRAIDGAPAASFLTELKECLENPYGLLV